MPPGADWPCAQGLSTARLDLEPLRVDHADEAEVMLSAPSLYLFMGGEPPGEAELRARFSRQVIGHSPDLTEGWLNWMARRRSHHDLIGTFQSTLRRDGGTLIAELAWVIGAAHQGRGYATEGATAMRDWLRTQGAGAFEAHILPGHHASAAVATRLGLSPTTTIVDGEVRWVS